MILSVLSFLIGFGILVLIHEFGHFWVARRAGVAVEKFSIGFGPKLFGFQSKGTDFCVSLIPLGGFVKMKGDEDETQIDPGDKTAFVNKSVAARSCVVMAGPFMNLLLSFVLLPIIFWVGKPEPAFLKEPPVVERILPGSPAEKAEFAIGDRILTIDGKGTTTWEEVLETVALTPPGKKLDFTLLRNATQKEILLETASLPGGEGSYLGIEKYFGTAPEATVKEVVPGSAAAEAGFQSGDQIVAIAEKPVANWDALTHEVNANGGKPLSVEVLRKNFKQTLTVQPRWDEEAKRWLLGIKGPENLSVGLLQTHRYTFPEAVKMGTKTNLKNIAMTFQVVKKLLTFELSYKNIGGPVQIAYTLSKTAASGFIDFLYFVCFLSVNLAVLNILPIPMLDGGHLLFFIIEGIRRKPLSIKVRMVAQQAGLALLLMLVLLVTFNDLKRLFFH